MHREFIESLENRCLLSGNGLVGYYYNDASFTNHAMTRNDSAIDFNFGNAGPVPQMGKNFSVKWESQILPPTTGVYTFYVDATDGVQLSIRGQAIITRDGDGSGELSGTISLVGQQKVDLELDYFNDTNNGDVHLSWSGPGISKQIVPNSVLYNSFGVNYTFTDPIAPTGQDPWVQFVNGEYYYCFSNGGALFVAASSTLQGIGTARAAQIFAPPGGTAYSSDLWAPELHYINGLWYVYFAADDGTNADHRMYVLQSANQNPQGRYTFKGEIEATPDQGVPNVTTAFTTDHWAIDGTVVTIGSQNYFVWSGWDGTSDGQQNLYIAAMSNPWTISGARHLLSVPTYSWEKNGLPINEGPEELQNGSNVFVIYSASGYWTNQYCLGQLEYNGTGDPLQQSSWLKSSSPVFQSNANAVGVGHASFTISPDGTQDWIVYHAHNTTGTFTGTRDVRIQQFTFNADGTPNFGSPVPTGVAIPEPSGTPHLAPSFNIPIYPTAPAVQVFGTSQFAQSADPSTAAPIPPAPAVQTPPAVPPTSSASPGTEPIAPPTIGSSDSAVPPVPKAAALPVAAAPVPTPPVEISPKPVAPIAPPSPPSPPLNLVQQAKVPATAVFASTAQITLPPVVSGISKAPAPADRNPVAAPMLEGHILARLMRVGSSWSVLGRITSPWANTVLTPIFLPTNLLERNGSGSELGSEDYRLPIQQ